MPDLLREITFVKMNHGPRLSIGIYYLIKVYKDRPRLSKNIHRLVLKPLNSNESAFCYFCYNPPASVKSCESHTMIYKNLATLDS